MKNYIYILIFGITIFSCNNSSKEKVEIIADKITEKKIDTLKKDKTTSTLIMTSPSSLEPSKDVILKGIKFTIVEKIKGDTTFWSTTDKKFKTPEGYSVGNKLKDISKLERAEIYKSPGYGYFINLNSGWELGFCEGTTCTDDEPTENSIVVWINKRK